MNAEMKIYSAGHVIRSAREEAGHSQALLAKLLSMPVSTLCRYEKNERPLSLRTIASIASHCNVEPAALAYECVKSAFPAVKDSELGGMLERIVTLFVLEITRERS